MRSIYEFHGEDAIKVGKLLKIELWADGTIKLDNNKVTNGYPLDRLKINGIKIPEVKNKGN